MFVFCGTSDLSPEREGVWDEVKEKVMKEQIFIKKRAEDKSERQRGKEKSEELKAA